MFKKSWEQISVQIVLIIFAQLNKLKIIEIYSFKSGIFNRNIITYLFCFKISIFFY